MVNHASNRRGASSLGCLVTLLVFAAALYYGVNIGEVYYRFYTFQEEMRSQARLAPSISDGVIRRRLLTTVDELGLPAEAQRIEIKRTARPRRILITSQYSEDVDLPLFKYTFHFKPHADAGL